MCAEDGEQDDDGDDEDVEVDGLDAELANPGVEDARGRGFGFAGPGVALGENDGA